MPWPALTDFSEAVQNPAVCFRGTELEAAQVAVNQRGLPMVFSGSFACVYSASIGNRRFAVRCFTREIKDQQSRYEQLSNYLINVLPPAFVYFEYLDHGINFRGDWYPIVRMEWVEGEPLSSFVGSRLDQPDVLRRTAAQWRGGTTASMRGLHIAHNDLQHGNVMVQKDGGIRLVDYDGMFLPQFRGERSPELGHKNYQHPQRSPEDYDDHVDNFPTLVIYTSLLSIASDAGLWSFFNDDNLIFTRGDYADPKHSDIFNLLKRSPDPTVARLTERLEECCALPVAEVPDLETILHDIPVGTAPPSPPPSAAPPQPHPPPAAAPTGNASGYRQMLQAQTGAPAPAPAMERQCPRCNSRNARTRRDWYKRRNALRCLDCNAVFGRTIIKRCPGCGGQEARLRRDWHQRGRPFRCRNCNAVFGGTDQTPPRQPVVGSTPNLVSYLAEATSAGSNAGDVMDRARGVMLGVAVGNLLGLPVEGRSRQRIQELYPNGVREIDPAEASRQMDDDPAQAVELAESLLERGDLIKRFAARLVTWQNVNGRGMGRLTRQSIAQLADRVPPSVASYAVFRARGGTASNGGIMRCAPVAVARRHLPERLVRDTADTCAVSHYAPACQWSCVIINVVAAVLISGNVPDLKRVLSAARADGCPDLKAVAQASGVPTGMLDASSSGNASPSDLFWMRGNRGPGGHTVLTMQAGLWAATTPLGFEESLIALVNAGGDADTNGALAGAVLGGRYGASAIPLRWTGYVPQRDRLTNLGERLARL